MAPKIEPKTKPQTVDVAEVLRLTARTPGWNNRTALPQCVVLASGCRLIVVPAWLWRPRIGQRPRKSQCPPITFPTRRGYHVPTFAGAGDFLRRMNGLYRSDLWSTTPYMAEVWAESRSIAGVIQDTCEELAVSLYPSGGFTSATLAHQAAENINAEAGERAVQIFYIGDYDQSGVLIDRSIESELRQHLDDGIDMEFHRIAINEEQIAAYDLPMKPRKDSDRRSPEVACTVEAEAMPAFILRGILRSRIEALLPADALHVAKVAEESEREHIERMADLLGKAA